MKKVFVSGATTHWMDNIRKVVTSSLWDIGVEIVEDRKEANIVLAIQHFLKEDAPKQTDTKYILYQVEQYTAKPQAVEGFYQFGPDEVWGFDIENTREIYTPLGYHPCLEFKASKKDVNVSFMGCITPRRVDLIEQMKYKPKQIRGFDHEQRGSLISRTFINLNLHSYGLFRYTQWDRISHFLANGCFFISEGFYCPVQVPQFYTPEQYDEMVDFYLNRAPLMRTIGGEMKYTYKTYFDMRDLLYRRLNKGLTGGNYS